MDALVGETRWGTVVEVINRYQISGLSADDTLQLYSMLSTEPGRALKPVLENKIPVTPNLDATFKTNTAEDTIHFAMTGHSTYWQKAEDVIATQVIGMDAMSGFIDEKVMNVIKAASEGARRSVIDQLIGESRITFNHKANDLQEIDKRVTEMEKSVGLVVLAVVKGTAMVSGLVKYGVVKTEPVSRAFLYVGEYGDSEKALIACEMRGNGIGISSGLKTQDIYKKKLIHTVYCGRLKGNGAQLESAFQGVSIDDIEWIVRENDKNVRNLLDAKGVKHKKDQLLTPPNNLLALFGYALVQLGTHIDKNLR